MEDNFYKENTIFLDPYQDQWEQQFANAKTELQKKFSNLSIKFYHIGSTAVIGCYAKPIIDILAVTPDIFQIDQHNISLEALGYRALGEYGIVQRRFFQKRAGILVNLHIFEDTAPEAECHIRFCDYLRQHPALVKEYSLLKRSLAKQFPKDIQSYCLGKQDFVKKVGIQAARQASSWKLPQQTKRKSSWSQEKIQKAMEANFLLHMTYFVPYLNSMEIVFEPDMVCVRSNLKEDTYNTVVSARFTEQNVKERIAAAIDHYKSKNLPFAWWLGPSDTPSHLSKALLAAGLSFSERNVGMVMDLEIFKPLSSASSLKVERVEDKETLDDFLNVLVKVGISPQAKHAIYYPLPPLLYQEKAPFEIYVGYANDQPVVTGILVCYANVAGIYYLMTTPKARKKGYGTVMMEHLLTRARSKGYALSTLQASEMGKHLYKRLGFKQTCTFDEYVYAGSHL